MKKLLLSLICFISLQANQISSYTLIQDAADLEILSPTLAERKTAKLRLQNGLEALLISDPGVKQSAAALAVQVGSWNDPSEYPGMAHFLEHMLFMGTAAYPQESEYAQYINEGGGARNAYTASDRTVYMFSVNNDRFEGALDRFSHFFIDPLFLPSCIERELHSVDQEFAKNIEHDGWRQYMIFKETANQDHPCAKFSCGNADTLKGIPQQDMKQWYQQNYSASKMHLVIYSALPLDDLIELTIHDFSSVSSNSQKVDPFPVTMFHENQKGTLTYIKPIKDIKRLSIIWELPESLAKDNQAMAGELVSYILQSGGKNSLLGALKRQHLAEEIQTSEDRFSPTNVIFNIDIKLTEKGVKEVHKVIETCFESLARLKKTGIPRYIFDEVKTICDVNYKYQSREDAFTYVSTTVHKMVDEALETFPQKTLIPTSYQPELYTQYIHHLSPKNALFFVTVDPQLSGIMPTKKEKWLGAEYAVEAIDSKLLNRWAEASIHSQIGLPLPNLFTPKNLDLINKSFHEDPIVPVKIADLPEGKIYYSDDTRYLVPQISYLFRIQSPLIDGSARSTALVDLYCKSLNNKLFPITQAARAAGSTIQITQGRFALIVSINGYTEPSFRLTENIFEATSKVKPTREEYTLFKQSLISKYESTSKELPVIQSFEIVKNVLFSGCPTNEEKIAAIKQLSYDEFCHFSTQLFQTSYIESLLYGNLTKDQAQKLSSNVLSTLKSKPFHAENHYKREILLLPQSKGPFMISRQTPMQGNAAVLVIQEGPYTFEKRASQEVLSKVIKNEFFETLRTKQQTGYIAMSWDQEEEMQLLQLFAVQSSTHLPNDLIARFELFLENFIKQYSTILPEERFDNVRQMAISLLAMPPENLTLSAGRLFALAFDYDADFQLIDKRIDALKKLTYEEMHQDAIQFLSRVNTKRLAVLLEGAAQKDREFRYELTSKKKLRAEGRFVTKNQEESTDSQSDTL